MDILGDHCAAPHKEEAEPIPGDRSRQDDSRHLGSLSYMVTPDPRTGMHVLPHTQAPGEGAQRGK